MVASDLLAVALVVEAIEVEGQVGREVGMQAASVAVATALVAAAAPFLAVPVKSLRSIAAAGLMAVVQVVQSRSLTWLSMRTVLRHWAQ